MQRTLVLASLFLLGCDGGETSPGTPDAAVDASSVDAAIDAPPDAPLTLTSAMLTEGSPFMVDNTCDGANTSPQLAWTNPPANAQSFAVVFTDKTNGLVHSVIYDIPSTVTSLPANVEKAYAPANVPGAHQTTTLGGGRGYAGPCPPVQDGPHTYEFALYAINAATLPGATMGTTRPQAVALIMANDVASALLTGTRDR